MDDRLGVPEFLCFQVVRTLQRKKGPNIPETDFNKFAFLVHERLKEKDFESGLPHFWLQYGEVVDRDEMHIPFLEFKEHRYQTNLGKRAALDRDYSHSDFAVNGGTETLIIETTEDTVSDFEDRYGTDIAKDYTYEEFAPEEFIIHLNNLRAFFEETDVTAPISRDSQVAGLETSFSEIIGVDETAVDEDVEGQDEFKTEVLRHLDRMVETYPTETYTYADKEFRQWESTTRQLTYNGIFDHVAQFTHDFWKMFSEVELRIRHNENIPKAKVQRWRNRRADIVERFRETLDDKRDVLLKNRESTDELERVADSYSQAVRELFADKRR